MAARAAALLVILAVAPTASADVVVDFESGNPFSGGTLSELYSTSATHSLFVGVDQGVSLAIPAQYLGGPVKVTMMVYDLGKWIDRTQTGHPGPDWTGPSSVYGPRWGVSTGTHGEDESAGATIIEKSFLASQQGYGFSHESRFTSSWWSPQWYGSPRQCTLSDDGGTYDEQTETWTMGTEGTGQWTQWTFEVTAAGAVTLYRDGGGTKSLDIGASATEVWIYGGRNHDTLGLPLADVYIDDVTIVPEPATMGLLGLGLLGLVVRRKK